MDKNHIKCIVYFFLYCFFFKKKKTIKNHIISQIQLEFNKWFYSKKINEDLFKKSFEFMKPFSKIHSLLKKKIIFYPSIRGEERLTNKNLYFKSPEKKLKNFFSRIKINSI